ncbi:MAG: Asp-tRNA(Asn)/Glu-tRNA(Gln) amidotransferase subunit GatC [Gammaproteobacteria bacterium]|nr:Asp-tRNA(Asn)/Glu-tRNA(Gln) amidotransferase subunit GatC [Gammaproteobacteria bacterium]MDP6616182.1 Asp-tRNA(Asn)/Glu-tRNA(Gln) amidotransferase subunit GatC [Gammaproteobacteria bacterium]MDP6695610.1 Asp-tRNA(Asn)/Glu-tRNA(Gln) amidotransferase subunit GatC [Gammaproteobacteria bacterium]MDP7042085.1 Asp-tRNA(Asn)/Glu-tRNA(Gln) amidotransferase subunit GatC [Gammaproteobacteria bacterium]
MALSKSDIEYIAQLAMLNIAEADVPDYQEKLGKIIDFIDELGKADTKDVVPMAHPLDMSQRLRPDVVAESDQRDYYQQNAEATAGGLYIVPKVIE